MGASVLGKAKNNWRVASGGSCKPPRGLRVMPWWMHGCKSPELFFLVKHAKMVIVRVNIKNISNHSVVTLNNVTLTFSTIISLSLQDRWQVKEEQLFFLSQTNCETRLCLQRFYLQTGVILVRVSKRNNFLKNNST